MKKIAFLIKEAMTHRENKTHLLALGKEVKLLTHSFPLYPEWK
jgi:hypothetical protein